MLRKAIVTHRCCSNRFLLLWILFSVSHLFQRTYSEAVFAIMSQLAYQQLLSVDLPVPDNVHTVLHVHLKPKKRFLFRSSVLNGTSCERILFNGFQNFVPACKSKGNVITYFYAITYKIYNSNRFLTSVALKSRFKGIDQWEKRGVGSGIIR